MGVFAIVALRPLVALRREDGTPPKTSQQLCTLSTQLIFLKYTIIPGKAVPMPVGRRFKARAMIGAPRRRLSRSFFPNGLWWQVGENFSAIEVDAVRIDVDHQASEA
ncbi:MULTISPECIES: hypothetical protein [Rhizobium]|uniref:Uncharacterized protein n=1 Tax=Rhizobium esperanzae TaxID=1967781 RepID=A0A7W6UI44_9HYPH|nr:MULTISPECIES: hypothetical protein [Rhizobium]MBB4437809.1 hypothetical protein [Rhizobium esperanzae]MDH6200906.1 hypothetical protein [Rhizobium leguminosarum]